MPAKAPPNAGKSVDAPVINPVLPVQRIASVDAYRGLVMLLMMAEVSARYRRHCRIAASGGR